MNDSAAKPVRRITLQCQFCQTWNRVDAARAKDKPKCAKCARPFLLDRPYPLNDDSFERTIRESDVPVMVDFYADWCGPCKMMAPYIDAVAAKNEGRVLVAKLNTDFNQNTARGFQIQGIPTTIVFRSGEVVSRQSGALPLAGLEQLLGGV